MANKTLIQLPAITIPSTGSNTYLIEGAQSYRGTLDKIAQILISEFGIFADPINANLMSSGTAQVILEGLNNASTAKLNASRINVDFDSFISGYFDIDGGTFYDTYSNASTFDGGNL